MMPAGTLSCNISSSWKQQIDRSKRLVLLILMIHGPNAPMHQNNLGVEMEIFDNNKH